MPNQKKSPSVASQVSSAKKSQASLLAELDDVERKVAEDIAYLRSIIGYAAPSFVPKIKKCSKKSVNRRGSMLCGPLFVSPNHPAPTSNGGALIPVLQLDLREISKLADKEIGDGLLQLWCNLVNLELVVEVIPRVDVDTEEVLPFTFVPPDNCFGGGKFEGFPLPLWFNQNPDNEIIDIIDGYSRGRFESQVDGHCGDYGLNFNDLFGSSFRKKLIEFGESTSQATFEGVTVLGTFLHIQYGSHDVQAHCLVSIADWGSTGSAQVFYKFMPDGSVDFKAEYSCR